MMKSGFLAGSADWTRRIFHVVSVLIIVGAFLLRAWRIDGPYEHFDEQITQYVSNHLETTPGWDINWKDCEIPYFSMSDQYNFSSYLYATHLFRRASAPLLPRAWNDERMGLVIHRLFSALCGTLVVIFVMLIARKAGGEWIALGAGFLCAVNVQLVEDSHYARPETFMGVLLIAAIWIGFGSAWRWRLPLMAALLGILTAVKFTNACLLMLPALLILRDHWVERQRGRETLVSLVRPVMVVAVFFIGALILGVPYLVLHPAKYFAGVKFLSTHYAGVHAPYTLPDHGPSWPTMWKCLVALQGWPVLVASVLGAVWCAVKRDWATTILLSVPMIGLVLFFGAQKMYVERNISPVVPAALILATIGFAVLFEKGWSTRLGGAAHVVVLIAVLLASIPGDHALRLLLKDGVNGAEQAHYQAHVKLIDQHFPNERRAMTSLFYENDMNWLRGELMTEKHRIVLGVFDFNDAYKKPGLEEMCWQYNVFPVAEYRGTFADYPLSSLNNFHGMCLRTYIVKTR